MTDETYRAPTDDVVAGAVEEYLRPPEGYDRMAMDALATLRAESPYLPDYDPETRPAFRAVQLERVLYNLLRSVGADVMRPVDLWQRNEQAAGR